MKINFNFNFKIFITFTFIIFFTFIIYYKRKLDVSIDCTHIYLYEHWY
jgi:hypothetical protein